MGLRYVYRTLERPVGPGLSSADTWREPLGHSTTFLYQYFGGHWGHWRHIYVDLKGEKQWAFIPFNDEQFMTGAGRMIYKQHHMPVGAKTGSAWVCPNGSFKRVLSRGGAWENLNIGSTHPDEVDHAAEEFERAEAQQQQPSPEVSLGAGELSSGDGNNGQMPGDGQQQVGEENASVEKLAADIFNAPKNYEEQNFPELVGFGEAPQGGTDLGGVDETSPPVV